MIRLLVFNLCVRVAEWRAAYAERQGNPANLMDQIKHAIGKGKP